MSSNMKRTTGRPPMEDRDTVASVPVTARLSPRAVRHLDALVDASDGKTSRSHIIHGLVLSDAERGAA